MGKTSDLFKDIRDTKGTFHAKMGTMKDRNGMDLTDAEAPYSQQKHDLEFTAAQSMNSLLQILNKVGKTSKPFWYDLNKIPYNYTVEVTNRFKGLDLIEFLNICEWRFMTLYSRQ